MTNHRVICPNGDTTDFDTEVAAQNWADWGHCCVSVALHKIEEVQD